MNNIIRFSYQSEIIMINLSLVRKICIHEGTREICIDSEVYSFRNNDSLFEYLINQLYIKWNMNS